MPNPSPGHVTGTPRAASGGEPPYWLRWTAIAVLTLLLTACGGGGAPGSAAPSPVVPQPVIAGCTLLYPSAGGTARSGTADPLFDNQWHLKPGNETTPGLGAAEAWASARGGGIRVAIIDGPVETLHDDLVANVDASASVDYRTGTPSAPLPCNTDDDHGTAVAGIIAGVRGNGLGGAGVAPEARLVAYNAIEKGVPTPVTQSRIADALRRDASRNQIYHNSWGSPDDGALHFVDDAVGNAIETGIREGRNGRGALYVFASGNGGCLSVDGATLPDPDDPTRCRNRDMTGFDGHLNVPGTITACAVDRHGRMPEWAEEGENLLVCGLSNASDGSNAITTTALRNGYRGDFDGASAAAPMVSGVIALMLEANPDLSWRDVRLILAETARETLPDDPSWRTTKLDQWPARPADGGGLVAKRFSRKFGFGVADAAAAVERARTLPGSVGASDSLKRCERSSQQTIAVSDPVPGGIQWSSATLSVKADDPPEARCGFTHIELVEVWFSATHHYAADLRIELVSPSGQLSALADSRYCGGTSNRNPVGNADRCGSYTGWRFLSNRMIGENPLGDWTLRVADAVTGEIGTWDRWTIRLSGH